MIIPGPKSIKDFPALPDSTKSTLEGDTIQVPNVSAYFSNNYRRFVIPFYLELFTKKTLLPFYPLRLNYPPEFAFTAIKDQTHSTYLEELVYPLRDSLFINGLEPFEENGEPKYLGASLFGVGGINYQTKVTLRYYPSSILVKIIVWLGINISAVYIYKLARRVLLNE